MLAPGPLTVIHGVLRGRRHGYGSRRSGHPAAGVGGQGRLICHARVAAAAIGALAIPVIEPGFPTLLITPVGLAQLFPPDAHAAWLPALDLPAITRQADEKHRHAAHGAAKQLPQ